MRVSLHGLLLLAGLGLGLAACGRPVTDREAAFLDALAGDSLDTQAIRIVDGHIAGALRLEIPVRPRRTCQERLWPPIEAARSMTVTPAATVAFDTIFLRSDLYRDDFLADLPDTVALLDIMLLAHEAVHVWQWQNRALTGYHPLRALTEHGLPDPYLFDPDTTGRFLDYGYEQQGAIVEEYVCCLALDPDAPRTARLRAMIGQALPLGSLETVLGDAAIRLPWPGAQTDGICRAGTG